MTDTALLRAALTAFALVAFLSPGRIDAAEPESRVLWVRGDHAYASLPDSTAAEAGDRVTFRDRKGNLATGDVTGVIRGEVAVIQITSGSLAGIRKLERVRLLFERAPLPALTAMRIGVPSARRRPECDGLAPGTSAAALTYRASMVAPMAWRFIRDSANSLVGAPAAWPDTVVVSLFDESADEEIALERGELDVAVFQPGELSAHMRGDPRVNGLLVMGAQHRRRVIAMGADALAGLVECRSEKAPR